MRNILLDLDLEPKALACLRALPGAVVTLTPPPHDGKPRALPAEVLRDQHVLLCKQPPTNFADLKSLALLQIATVGFEHLAHLKLHESPARVCNARGIFDTAIAEWNLAMMINLVRDLRGMIRNQETKTWDRGTRFQQEIRGKTVGLWGYGGIGRETARLAKAFGMTVWCLTRSCVGPRLNDYTPAGTGDPEGRLPDRAFAYGDRDEFLAGVDFLILALPRTSQTDGMIGERELRTMKHSAFVLNPARGPIIQESALLSALRENWIAGAALDTHYAYPLPPEHSLWSMPNVILSPHISGADGSTQYPPRIGDLFVQNVERFLTGQPLLNEVTKEALRESQRVRS